MSEEIVVDFFRNGTVKVETFGYVGSSCKEATEFLNSLGSVTNETEKPEYWNDVPEFVHTR